MDQLKKIGQLFSPAAFIHDTEENILEMESLIRNQHIGGITFFHSRYSAAANFEKRQEKLVYKDTLEKLQALIQRYQKISKTPLLISIDAEFGLAMRLENTPQYPYAITLGAMSEKEIDLIFETGYRIGKDLRDIGIHLNFAPVADINTNPKNPVIGYRSFGRDRNKVSNFALAMYKGMVKAGIGACYKHFPGHGDTDVDSHLGLPVINKSKAKLLEEELYPFIEGIKDGIDMIMVGHLAAPALCHGKNTPASISRDIITGFLKGELGFKGLVVSDALNMKSVSDMYPEPGRLEWEAFHAGNDILCFSENVSEATKLIAEKASSIQVDVSFQKIMKLKETLGLFDQSSIRFQGFDWDSHHAFNQQLAKEYITVISENESVPKIPMDLHNRKTALVSVYKGKDNLFFQGIDPNNLIPKFEISHNVDFDFQKLVDFESILIALFVPSAKPINHFGLETQLMKKITELIANKNVELFLFGTPLVLSELPDFEKMQKIVCAYQDFEVTQKETARYFLG
ncbi:glycoside hydrolase family 3 protein [Aquiflexum lacus]|uniref:glycoside hydrolase family 3 protein n=1 Tax=Aquiflexum lacus TaxID=2483805 RepID=UPI0018961EFD|nr:glycoside hydrolase family 3 protein [Aquiflexum lacus]